MTNQTITVPVSKSQICICQDTSAANADIDVLDLDERCVGVGVALAALVAQVLSPTTETLVSILPTIMLLWWGLGTLCH